MRDRLVSVVTSMRVEIVKYYVVLIGVVGISMAACSNRDVYATLQNNNQLDCQKKPVSQQEECERLASKSYEEYERERQELLKKED